MRGSHSPGIVGGARGHTEQLTTRVADGRAWHDSPACTVPVLNQWLEYAPCVREMSHGPDVGGRSSRDGSQQIVLSPRAGAGHIGPTRAVPPFRECLL